MTYHEFADFFGISRRRSKRYFKTAAKKMPSINAKFKNRTCNPDLVTNFSLEECIAALDAWAFYSYHYVCPTPMMVRLLIENFIYHDGTTYRFRDSLKFKFMPEKIKKVFDAYDNHQKLPKVCATCVYLEKRCSVAARSKPMPYCSFYRKMLMMGRVHNDIYTDYCNAYIKTPNEPVFYLVRSCLNSYPRVNKVNNSCLGFSQSSFTGKRKKGTPIYLLKDGTNYKEKDYQVPEGVENEEDYLLSQMNFLTPEQP